MQTVEIIGGIIIIALVLYDVFMSVVVPRQSSPKMRISPFLTARFFWPFQVFLSKLVPNAEWKLLVLETFAPVCFVLMMLIWLGLLICGYALMLLALGGQVTPPIREFSEAFYFAGTSVLTIGFGDVVAQGPQTRMVVLMAGLTGLSFMALEVSHLFTIQNWMQQREQGVNTLISRAGSPTSGLIILLRYKELNIANTLGATFLGWESWVAAIHESHRTFPILIFSRASNRYDSWLSAIGAMLDAASILLTSIEDNTPGEADLFYWLACSTLKSLCKYQRIELTDSAMMTRQQWQDGLALLSDAGYRVKSDDKAWREFSSRRAGYMGYLQSISNRCSLPLQSWIYELKI